jgi:hypothetical protein
MTHQRNHRYHLSFFSSLFFLLFLYRKGYPCNSGVAGRAKQDLEDSTTEAAQGYETDILQKHAGRAGSKGEFFVN